MKKVIIAMAIVFSFGVLGQAADTKWEVGAGLVNSMPMNTELKDVIKSALGFNIYGDYAISEKFTAGIEVASLSYDSKGIFKAFGIDSIDIMTYGVRGKYVKPMDFGSMKGKIYGILGIASYVSKTDPSFSSAESTDTGFNLGAGLDVEVATNLLVGFELRYHLIASDVKTLDPALKVAYCF